MEDSLIRITPAFSVVQTSNRQEKPMPRTLYLIDAYAQIFRAFFAIRNGMRSQITGEPTHAVFGFTGMLIKLLTQLDPTYVVVAIDTPGRTFRDDVYLKYAALKHGSTLPDVPLDPTLAAELESAPPVLGPQYSEYKGTRNVTPEDLIAQVPRVFEVVEGLGIPVVGEVGIEADDVIATITQRILDDPEFADVQIRIVSKDKDLEQLICDRVSLFDIHTDTLIDAEALLSSKGITPSQVVDVLTLMGDTADNIPGIDGIGLKTAAQLVQQYGSIEGIIENIGEIKGKRQLNLLRGLAILPISRELVTLKRDADFLFHIENSRVGRIDTGRLIPVFEQLGFNRYQEDVNRLAAKWDATIPETEAETETETGTKTKTKTKTVADPHDAEATNRERALTSEVNGVSDLAGIGKFEGVPYETAASGEYRSVVTIEQLNKLISDLNEYPIIALDTETTGLERDAAIVGISFSWREGQGVYVPILSPTPEFHLTADEVLQALKPILESSDVAKCGHNLKFDAHVLLNHGIRLRGVVFDSMLASILLDPSRGAHKLDNLAQSELYYKMIPITDLIGADNQVTMDQIPVSRITTYAAEDTDIALRMYHKLQPQIESARIDNLMRTIEAPLTTVLAVMERNGILCDAEVLQEQGKVLKLRVDALRAEIFELCGVEFHLESTQQLADVLFDRLGFTAGKKTKTGRSTDISVLEKLAAQEDRNDPGTAVPRLIIEFRQLTKLISTYLGNLQSSIDLSTGRIHTSFHQLLTATGRLASSNPNLQNIPVRSDAGRQIRKAFHAPAGCVLICADYSQIELRMLAHLSHDVALLDAFDRDLDIHAAVASQVFGVDLDQVSREQRSRAKTINFGIIYGITPFGLARRIEGLDVGSATALIDEYKTRFPGIQRFMLKCIDEALNTGKVSTITGRTRAIPEILSVNRMQRSMGERFAINTVVQGSAADLIKAAMVNLQDRIERDSLPMKLLLQIHDELVLEAPEAEAAECAAIVCHEMETAMSLSVPLKAEAGVGRDWFSAK